VAPVAPLAPVATLAETKPVTYTHLGAHPIIPTHVVEKTETPAPM